MSIELVMPSNHLILCCPLLFLPSIFPSIRVSSNESALGIIRWSKYWSFSITPSNEYSGLISFRIVWFHLLSVQGTLKSLLQHQNSKASILQRSAFFMVQLSYPYMTIGKTIALTRRTFIGKVMSLLFNMLSRFVIAFLPRSKHLNFMAAVTICSDFGAQENKVFHCFYCFPIYLLWILNDSFKKKTRIHKSLLICFIVNSSISECYCLSFSAVIFVPGAAEDEMVRQHQLTQWTQTWTNSGR